MDAWRTAVVEEAKRWLRTPWMHRSRIRGVGVDCAQLLIGVFSGAGVIEAFDTGEYPVDWMLHRDEELYLAWVRPYAREITREQVQPGDLAMWKFGRTYSHSAIVIDPPTIIHAVQRCQAVVLGNMDHDADLIGRPVLYFSLFGEA